MIDRTRYPSTTTIPYHHQQQQHHHHQQQQQHQHNFLRHGSAVNMKGSPANSTGINIISGGVGGGTNNAGIDSTDLGQSGYL